MSDYGFKMLEPARTLAERAAQLVEQGEGEQAITVFQQAVAACEGPARMAARAQIYGFYAARGLKALQANQSYTAALDFRNALGFAEEGEEARDAWCQAGLGIALLSLHASRRASASVTERAAWLGGAIRAFELALEAGVDLPWVTQDRVLFAFSKALGTLADYPSALAEWQGVSDPVELNSLRGTLYRRALTAAEQAVRLAPTPLNAERLDIARSDLGRWERGEPPDVA